MAFIYDGKDLDKLDVDEVLDIYNKMTPEEQFTYSKYKAEQEAEPGFNYDLATKRTFTESVEPYEFLMGIEDDFKRNQEVIKMQNKAVDLGLTKTQFKTLWHAYQDSHNGYKSVEMDNLSRTQFTDQDQEYRTSWIATDNGVYKQTEHGKKVACSHPIYISKVLENIDTSLESVELKFKPRKNWKTVVVSRSTINNVNSITKLADQGVLVNSNNAKNLIDYLAELEAVNRDCIPMLDASSRLGWFRGIEEFIPYSKEVQFDGDANLSKIFDSVKPTGDKEVEYSYTKEVWNLGPEAKIMLSGAVASLLVKICKTHVTFYHIWSSKSSTGKTVILNTAASIFGRPKDYVQNFNSTKVAQERTANTLKNLPFCLDEYQTAGYNYSVYYLAEGQGKGRANKDGSLRDSGGWQNTILTNGESPLISRNDGEGAFARAVQVEIRDILVDFEMGNRISHLSDENYGYIGLGIVKMIQGLGEDDIKKRFNQLSTQINDLGTIQQKHIGSGAIAILASELLATLLRSEPLTVSDIEPYLLKKDDESIGVRAYDYINDFIASNSNRFEDMDDDNNQGSSFSETYGQIEYEGIGDDKEAVKAYIISRTFDQIMDEAGFPVDSVLSEWEKLDLIEVEVRGDKLRYRKRKTINGNRVYCIIIDLGRDPLEEQYDQVGHPSGPFQAIRNAGWA